MKNLIGFFFVFSLFSIHAQAPDKEVIAENKVVLIKPKNTVKTAIGIKVKHAAKDTDAKPENVLTSIKSDVLSGFSSGNANLLAKYFPSNIDISILGKSNLYSKSQAQQVLNTFFTQNKPSSFSVVHEGQSNGTKYFIGTYKSATAQYRVTINIKTVGGSDQISSISIEK